MYESLSSADNAALALVIADTLATGRAGLATDIDGTISQIVARPQDARVSPAARTVLAGLSQVLDVVAVVTGRRVADARLMLQLDDLVYVGNHGFETWTRQTGEQLVPESELWIARIARVLAEIQARLPADTVFIEDKGVSASLHYRLAADPPRVREQVLDVLARLDDGRALRVEEGRLVINLLPPLDINKGSAMTWLAATHHLDSLVYFGDDVTDTHAFTALEVMRRSKTLKTLSVAVVGRETAAAVECLADVKVDSVEAVADVLQQVLDRLRAGVTITSGVPIVGSETHGHGRASD